MLSGTLQSILLKVKANAGRYYVYLLCRPSGEPFYVGCGKAQLRGRQRLAFHEGEAKSGVSSHKCNAIREIWRADGAVSYVIDSWHDTETLMFSREIELISEIGRADKGRGPLANWSDGGDGLINRADAVRQRASKTMLSRVDETWRQRSAERTAAHWRSEEGRAKRLAVNASPETKARQSAASRATAASESNIKRAETMRALWNEDPGYVERQNQSHAVAVARPEYRQKLSQKLAERWADPEYKERLRQIHRERWARRKSITT